MMNLNNKVAVVFAANGAIASEVAKALAQHGAEVFLSGRNLDRLQLLADEINKNGGYAKAYTVDALDESQIDSFITEIVAEKYRLDVVFNGIGLRAAELDYGTPSTQLSFDKFMMALQTNLGSQFLTSRLAARHMMASGSRGTIITLTASLSRIKAPLMAGITAACAGIEGLTRSLAAEYGRSGIKVICLNPTALTDTRTIKETNELNAKAAGMQSEALLEQMKSNYLLGKSPETRDIGELAAFLASDTGALLNSHVIDADFGTFNVI